MQLQLHLQPAFVLQRSQEADGVDGVKEALAGIKRRRTAALKELADATAKRDKQVWDLYNTARLQQRRHIAPRPSATE